MKSILPAETASTLTTKAIKEMNKFINTKVDTLNKEIKAKAKKSWSYLRFDFLRFEKNSPDYKKLKQVFQKNPDILHTLAWRLQRRLKEIGYQVVIKNYDFSIKEGFKHRKLYQLLISWDSSPRKVPKT